MSSFAMTKSLKRIAQVAELDKRYKIEAYLFVQQSLAFAQLQRGRVAGQNVHDEADTADEDEVLPVSDSHLTGQELCSAIRLYAQELYGLLARPVLKSWGITKTGDFGDIVYRLIEIGEMTKSETDQREDFDDVFDFTDAFERDFQIQVGEDP